MTKLLRAEAYRAGADVTKVIVNAEVKAGDDGADATTPGGAKDNPWLSNVETCWQLKAGNAGQPKKLKGEVTKPIPIEILRNGGRFVVVASGAVDGAKGIAERKRQLVSDAKKAKLPTDKIEVFTCESLTTWINEHVAIAAELVGLPGGFATLQKWAQDPRHADPWVSSPALEGQLAHVRAIIAFDRPSTRQHLHVFGKPGIGKTRFVLEACHNATWSQSVLYVPQWAEADIGNLLAAVDRSGNNRLVLVVDEVPPEQVGSLAFHASSRPEHMRVISIGHHAPPDDATTEHLEVHRLDDEAMSILIGASHPDMPAEHVDYVVAFADGYTRLARMAAKAVDEEPDLQTTDLFSPGGNIAQLMNRMIGSHDRGSLHVVALLASVGWAGTREEEGKAISAHLGIPWPDVQRRVEEFHRKLGIAPRANDLRYISPAPLGVYLAIDAWQTYPDLVRALPDKLPSEQARRAFFERFEAVAASPRAKQFGEEELARFFHWSHFTDGAAARRWVTLSLANPAIAAANVRKALQAASDDDRRTVQDTARRSLVRGLVRLATFPDAFRNATLALAELAAAENESWANNASAEFVARFAVSLSGTATPYMERIELLDEVIAANRPALTALVVNALSRAIPGPEMLLVEGVTRKGLAPLPWRPKTVQEYLECTRIALERLEHVVTLEVPEDTIVHAAERFNMALRDEPIREHAARVFRAATSAHPAVREPLRRKVHDIAYNTRLHWQDRSESHIAWLEALERDLSDPSEAGQLRELVGHVDWERTEESLRPLAEKLVLSPDVMWAQWAWLASGEATGAWDLGLALAKADPSQSLLPRLIAASNTGRDARLLAAYVQEVARSQSAGWLSNWLDERERTRDVSAPTLFDLTRRIDGSSRGAQRLIRMAHADLLPSDAAAQLAFGPWVLGPSLDVLREILDLLVAAPGNHRSLLRMLGSRLRHHPNDLAGLEDLALRLACDPANLLADTSSSYHWDRIAKLLVPKHSGEIASTVFEATAHRFSSPNEIDDVNRPARVRFFLDSSLARNTLDACIRADANAVWTALEPHLADERGAVLFSIGFPPNILEAMPRQAVLDWIEVEPTKRALLIANLTAKICTPDTTLAATILDRWGTIHHLREQFFSAFISGGWSGDASAHWAQLATQADELAKQTKLLGVKRWAQYAARELRQMSTQDRKREEEERIRRYG
ncbi:MAG TPA: hypothetical protein VH165_33755 [Kofleriaceae bacterium]|nr:hypothetical protein [Kofleriaceae bacterium]